MVYYAAYQSLDLVPAFVFFSGFFLFYFHLMNLEVTHFLF